MRIFARCMGMGLLASGLFCGGVLAQGWQHLGKVQSVEKLKDGVELTAGPRKCASRYSATVCSACGLLRTGHFQRIFPGP